VNVDAAPTQASCDEAEEGCCCRVYRVMAIVEYDGTQYLGFQIQRSGRTVQGELERAIAHVTQRRTRIVGAGRTDAGVHARGQVIHFDTRWKHSLADLQRALNAVLARDVAIVQLRAVSSDFSARYSARSREYVYTILNRLERSPLGERYAYHYPKPLDDRAMDRACACLVGTRDFMPFGWPPRGDNTVRTVFRAGCRRQGDLVYVSITADAFLRSMVRRIVGNLMLVGCGVITVEEMAGLFALKHRRTPAVGAPAHGLCLVQVNYSISDVLS
jgi:tRNA pseudouridine38-40 synthase